MHQQDVDAGMQCMLQPTQGTAHVCTAAAATRIAPSCSQCTVTAYSAASGVQPGVQQGVRTPLTCTDTDSEICASHRSQVPRQTCQQNCRTRPRPVLTVIITSVVLLLISMMCMFILREANLICFQPQFKECYSRASGKAVSPGPVSATKKPDTVVDILRTKKSGAHLYLNPHYPVTEYAMKLVGGWDATIANTAYMTSDMHLSENHACVVIPRDSTYYISYKVTCEVASHVSSIEHRLVRVSKDYELPSTCSDYQEVTLDKGKWFRGQTTALTLPAIAPTLSRGDRICISVDASCKLCNSSNCRMDSYFDVVDIIS